MYLDWRLIIGTAAALCTTIAFIPQFMKIRRYGGRDVSYAMLVLYLVGVLLWLAYGLIVNAGAIIVANAIATVLLSACAAMKWIRERRPAPESAACGKPLPAERVDA